MGFKEVTSLDANETIALGGFNKKARKENPTSVTGYYLGTKTVASPKSKSGKSLIHFFQTASGNLGVWGKTDMDNKLAAVALGTMTRVTFSGEKQLRTGNSMYTYRVEADDSNTIEVTAAPQQAAGVFSEEEYSEESDYEDDVPYLDEKNPSRPQPPKRAAAAPTADSQAKVAALLAKGRASAQS